jgi:hypothetical protein
MFSPLSPPDAREEHASKKKAAPEMASRSLKVLKKLKKALNHKGFWPFLLRRNL